MARKWAFAVSIRFRSLPSGVSGRTLRWPGFGNSELSLAVLDIATFLVAMGFRVAVADGATHPIGEAFCAAVELLLALGD